MISLSFVGMMEADCEFAAKAFRFFFGHAQLFVNDFRDLPSDTSNADSPRGVKERKHQAHTSSVSLQHLLIYLKIPM